MSILTLQYVRRAENGRDFEARLVDFRHELTVIRPTLERLQAMVMWLTEMIEQPGRKLDDFLEQRRRIKELFEAAAKTECQPVPELPVCDVGCCNRDQQLIEEPVLEGGAV